MTDETLNDEHIDKSQWLPKGAAIVTPERAAMRDVKLFFCEETGYMQEVKTMVKNILNYLWEVRAITDQHNNDGHTLRAWRAQHRVALGLQHPTGTDGATPTQAKLRAYGYILVIRRLSQPDFRAIEQALDTEATEHTEFWLIVPD